MAKSLCVVDTRTIRIPCSVETRPACKIASGERKAMRNNVRAAPDGSRRPCSHSCKVRTETQSSFANAYCDTPYFIRASVAAVTATLVTRASPRLAWRRDSSKSFSNVVNFRSLTGPFSPKSALVFFTASSKRLAFLALGFDGVFIFKIMPLHGVACNPSPQTLTHINPLWPSHT